VGQAVFNPSLGSGASSAPFCLVVVIRMKVESSSVHSCLA
jgi:hypothetical protein